METSFIFDKTGQIKIQKLTGFFRFQTRTIIRERGDRVLTTRKMALGLLAYFQTNSDFQKTILAENELAAVQFANQ